jgi:hypothetical protein
MFSAALCDHRFDAAFAQSPTMRIGIVTTIGIDDLGSLKWSTARAADRGNRGDVYMALRPSECQIIEYYSSVSIIFQSRSNLTSHRDATEPIVWMIVQPSTWNEQVKSCETMLFLAASGESVFNSPQKTHYPTSTVVSR